MKVTVLGIYGGYPYAGVPSSSYLIQEGDFNLLLDAGSGSLLALEKILDPLQLDGVLLSHYHHDHAADVGVLQYYWQLHQGQKKHEFLNIYGHTQDPSAYASLSLDGVAKGHSYNDFSTLDLGPFKIDFLRTVHPVPAYAMRIENEKGELLVYTADTAYFDGLVDFSKNADLIIADTNFDSKKTGRIWHMTSIQSAELAKKSNAKSLLLSHLPQQINHSHLLNETIVIFKNTNIATQYLSIDLTKL